MVCDLNAESKPAVFARLKDSIYECSLDQTLVEFARYSLN